MPEWTATVLIAVISAAAGAIPGLAALHRARTERITQTATIEAKATETALALWESLNLAQSQRIQELTGRLVESEQRLAESERRLSESERAVRHEREINRQLSERLDALERELTALKGELAARDKRISELEACR